VSKDWFADIAAMHDHYGMTEKFEAMDEEKLQALLRFRNNFIGEEFDELIQSETAEDTIDALIDIIVVSIGSLHAFGVDGHKAWDEVLKANMAKEPGIKPQRPNPLGLPDLIKPTGWTPPSHEGNHGRVPATPKSPDECV
jgi:hypothetical protein